MDNFTGSWHQWELAVKITNMDIITTCFPTSKEIHKFSPNLIIGDESCRTISSPDMPTILHEASLFLGTDGCWLKPFSRWRLWTLLSGVGILSHTENIQLLAEWQELLTSSSTFLNNIKYKPITFFECTVGCNDALMMDYYTHNQQVVVSLLNQSTASNLEQVANVLLLCIVLIIWNKQCCTVLQY